MASLAELQSQLANEEAALVEIKKELGELNDRITEGQTEFQSLNADKLKKIEQAVPAQRAIEQVNNQIWETEQGLQRNMGSKLDKTEEQVASEAKIEKLKADIKKAGG